MTIWARSRASSKRS